MGNLPKSVGTLLAGLAMKRAVGYPFDYILYPLMLIWLGNVLGGIIMIFLALILNIMIIRAYDWSKVDWLLIERIKHAQEFDESRNWFSRFFKILKKNKVVMFFTLCLDDPVTVTLYFRKGSYRFNGMNTHDWRIFLSANVVANLYWIVGWALLIEIVRKF